MLSDNSTKWLGCREDTRGTRAQQMADPSNPTYTSDVNDGEYTSCPEKK